MNFKSLYTEARENIELALLSLWSPANHRMRNAMKDLIRREPLFAEPVFQSMFPWESTTDSNWRSYIAPEVIQLQENKASQNGYVYTPFEHQAKSWKELKEGNSIVVTSGTGSGKTECFMLPILSDIYSRRNYYNGNDPVEAIFLYPLNALMQDQKDRLGGDCHELGLKFAVYNRSLKDTTAVGAPNPNYPDSEVRTRRAVREMQPNGIPSCPQILLTNPSMLEYMLVRNSDQSIFERSRGRLKWIVIDEAHTYTGSAAIELAYLIKRVLSAFDVDRSEVQFVCTSATIGDPNRPQELLDFIGTITGEIPVGCTQQLVHIDGNRIVPPVDINDVQNALDSAGLGTLSVPSVRAVREDINNMPLSLSSIWATLSNSPYCTESCLELLDKLCNIKIGNDYLLMAKGHFFIRTINGLYTCVNEHCSAHNIGNGTGFGYLTTEKGTSRCPHCGAPLLEIVQCGDCKEFMLVCEENDEHVIRPTYVQSENSYIDDEDDGGDDNNTDGGMFTDNTWQKLYLAYFGNGRIYKKPHPNYEESKISIAWNGSSLIAAEHPGSCWYKLANENKLYCPNCVRGSGEEGTNFRNFCLSSNWVNGVIAPALLQEGRDAVNCWGKYIAFTDSRQGTAINAKRFNIDSERSYSRSRIVDELSDSNNHPQIRQLRGIGLPDDLFREAVNALNLENQLPTFSLREFAECIFNQSIFEHIDFDASRNISGRMHYTDEEAYKNALLRSNVGRRPMHLANHENLGFITLSYPSLDNAVLSNNWANAGFTKEEFQSFLKICIDYHLRIRNHIQGYYPNEIQYIRESNRSTPYNPADWPRVLVENSQPKITQNRLILLLCAALDIDDTDKLAANEQKINDLMKDAWDYLSRNTLSMVDSQDAYYAEVDDQGNHTYDGWYYIDFSLNSNKCKIKAAQTLYVCPFSYYLLDTTFRGYSPAIKGTVCAENFSKFKLADDAAVSMPIYRSPDFNDRKNDLISKGIWNDRHKYAYQPSIEGYLTAEHSGQQDRGILDYYTEQFKSTPHRLNLLQCSTTMEMGVDIGDIDTVLMTSVPPTSANYLQRAGRAGRRGQSKAVALSLCPHTSIGLQAFRNPMRNLISRNPAIKPVESAIIIQRHMNSFLVREYVTANDIAFNTVHEWLYKNGFYCEFNNWIDARRNDVVIKDKFTQVFGDSNSLSNAITSAIMAIDNIAMDYQEVIDNIEQEIVNAQGNQARIDALSIQANTLSCQELKGYLAEKQFLPNADMPTGVVEFNHIDAYNYTILNNTTQELETRRRDLQNATLQAQANTIRHHILELEKRIDEIKNRTVTSREIKVALSEYAPGQTVVINERNYISAGIDWNNSYGQRQPWKYFYHCHTCGRYEYTDDSTLTTCTCGSLYHNILRPNQAQQFSMAIEPIRFRTDVNRGINRQEHTVKTFYQIQTILTNVDWGNCITGPQCDIVGCDDAKGDIVFYNVGAGSGFSLCLDCGKMEVTRTPRTSTNWPHKDIRQHNVPCPVNHAKNNILLSGKFPTSFVSLRFYKDASRTEYVNDVDLLYSLGVILCRALVQTIGVSNDEVDFDVRQERNYASIYIYDTSKGGCDYSTELLDMNILNETFDRAKRLLNSFACHCEDQVNSACVRCLVDRNSQRYEKNLSKHKLLAWFSGQTMSTVASRSGALAVPMPLKLLVTNLYSRATKHDFTFCVDANNMNALDWASKDGSMGRIVHECINRGKNVTILVSNVPNAQKGAKLNDIIPFIDFPAKFPNCTVRAIASLEVTPSVYSALIINNSEHYFTETDGVLEFNESWGDMCTHLYSDNNIPSFTEEAFPTVNDAIALTQPDEITRSATIAYRGDIRLNQIYSLIKNSLLQNNDDVEIHRILSGKTVNITFSDSYVNSALAALILVNIIKEIKETYDFEINEVSLQIQGPKRNCHNDRWNPYTWISWSFPDSDAADNYIREVFEEYLDITPVFSTIIPDHYRWLRFKPVGEDKYIELRPDHGILGGWQSNHIYRDLMYINEYTKIESKDNISIVYYLIIKK